MHDSDYQNFCETLVSTAAVFGKELAATSIGIYWQVLKPLSIEDFNSAVRLHLSDPETGQFMPKPADIMKHSNRGVSSRQIGNEQAREKWLALKKREFETGIPAFGAAEIQRGMNLENVS